MVLSKQGNRMSLCDFSGMNGKRGLFISAVIHKVYVDMNEESTEAMAATIVTIAVSKKLV